MQELAGQLGTDPDHPWSRFAPGSERGPAVRRDRSSGCGGPSTRCTPVPAIPADIGRTPSGTASTQAALGRALLDLTREAPEAARRVVTVSPDVSSSTNLGGWINKVGVWSPAERTDWFADDSRDGAALAGEADRPAHRARASPKPTWSACSASSGRPGAGGGSRCCRSASCTTRSSNGRSSPGRSASTRAASPILVGTPSGVTLAPEGGAHQSITTPSIGIEQPGCVSYEPAFAIDVEWTLLACLAQLGKPDGTSAYLRLSTRPVDQALAAVPADPAARERRRRQVVAGAYCLRRTPNPQVTIAAMGAVIPEALAAAERLDASGVPADVICVTSPGLLFKALQARQGRDEGPGMDPGPGVSCLPGHPAGHRPRRAPPHARVPGHH